MGEFRNGGSLSMGEAKPMTELEKAKADMDYCRRKGGFAYKQAKAHYERLLQKSRRKEHEPREL